MLLLVAWRVSRISDNAAPLNSPNLPIVLSDQIAVREPLALQPRIRARIWSMVSMDLTFSLPANSFFRPVRVRHATDVLADRVLHRPMRPVCTFIALVSSV